MYSYLQDNGYNPQPLSKGSLGGLSFEDGGGFKVTWVEIESYNIILLELIMVE